MTSTTIKPQKEITLDTEIRIRRAQLALTTSKFIVGGVIVSITLTFIMWLFMRQYRQLLILIPVDTLILVSAGLYPLFHRRNQVIAGVYFVIGSFVLVFLILPILVPQLILVVFIGYLLIIVMCYLLLGDKAGRWLTGVCTLAASANITLIEVWNPGWFTPLDKTSGWVIQTILVPFVIFIAALIIRNAIMGQEQSFRQAKLANLEAEKQATQLELARLEIENRAAAEQEQYEHLQTTIVRYVDYMTQIAEGNLSTRLILSENGQGPDDHLLILGQNLNNMVERLKEMITQIHEATTHITTAAAEILAATTQQAAAANEQSAAISQTSTTIDEVKTIVEQAFSKAQAVARQAQRTSEVSQAGQQAVRQTVESINEIKEKVEGIAENILALSEQTQQISEITATVDDIASQSNLLALNASVEAARAGEHGKGFAVVAVEVRNLAEQSRQATAQVKAILNEIQRATNTAVMATEEGTKGVDSGVRLIGQTGDTIKELTDSIVESANAARQIVASAQQQTTGMEQISLAMQNINQATVQNLASIRQAEKSAQDLSSVTQQMEALILKYKLD
jgi:methyl-accepting chemotaxis protein